MNTAQVQDLFYPAGRGKAVSLAVKIKHLLIPQDLEAVQVFLTRFQIVFPVAGGNIAVFLIQFFQVLFQAEGCLQIGGQF